MARQHERSQNVPLSTWKKIKMGVVAGILGSYALSGSCRIHQELTPINSPPPQLWGATCPKEWAPYCNTPNFGKLGIHRLLNPEKTEGRERFTNNDGYHGPDIIDSRAPGSPLLTGFLGGSTTYGPYHSYVLGVAARLSREFPETQFANLGMGAYTIIENKAQLREELIPKGVDVVVVSEPWNLTVGRAVEGGEIRRPITERVLGKITPTLAYNLAERIKQKIYFREGDAQLTAASQDRIDAAIESYQQHLEGIRDLCKKNNVQLILGAHPDGAEDLEALREIQEISVVYNGVTATVRNPYQRVLFKREITAATREFAGEQQIPLIDWETEFERLPTKEGLFLEDLIHLTEEGNRKMAEIAAPIIRRELRARAKETARVLIPHLRTQGRL